MATLEQCLPPRLCASQPDDLVENTATDQWLERALHDEVDLDA